MTLRISFYAFLPLILLAGLTPVAAHAQRLYRVTDLGDLPGGNSESIAYGLNEAGDVVGSGFSSPSFGPVAVLWSGGTITDLGDLVGGTTRSEAFAINDAGRIVGFGASTASSERAVTWIGGVISELGDLPGGASNGQAFDVNLLGRAVGESGGTPTTLASRFEGGSVFELGIPNGTGIFPAGSQAYAVNAAGVMVGSAAIGSGGAARPLRWAADGSVTDLGALYPAQRDSAEALDINDSGVIVGWTGITSSTRAARWVGPVITDLGDLPGGADSGRAHAINAEGQIVGESSATDGTHAFLWEDGVLFDLNDLIDPSDPLFSQVELLVAYDINGAGQIVGYASFPGGFHGFLLNPVAPVPSGSWPLILFALLATGLLALRARQESEALQPLPNRSRR